MQRILDLRTLFTLTDEVTRASLSLNPALVALLTVAGIAYPAPPKEWLDESTWPALVQTKTLKANKADDEMTRLLKERFNECQKELRDRYIYWLQGQGTLGEVADASRRAIEYRLEVKEPAADRIKLLKEQAEVARKAEVQAEELCKQRRTTKHVIDRNFAKVFRLDAEVQHARARRNEKDPSK